MARIEWTDEDGAEIVPDQFHRPRKDGVFCSTCDRATDSIWKPFAHGIRAYCAVCGEFKATLDAEWAPRQQQEDDMFGGATAAEEPKKKGRQLTGWEWQQKKKAKREREARQYELFDDTQG